jgi:hypothetical protein
MSDITDWEPENLLNSYDVQVIGDYVATLEPKDPLVRLGELEEKFKALEAQHAKALQQARDSHEATFKAFKTDVLVTLKALELVAIASQRNGQISLNHHVRDMRLQHLQSIITNAISDFCDRALSPYYTDDF